MSDSVVKLFQSGGGEFISPPSLFIDKLKKIKGIIFDWDGVFNDGFKRGTEGSPFSEVDSMGTNLLRFALWRMTGKLPITAVITGENNQAAQTLSQREHFHELCFLSKNKVATLESLCEKYSLRPEEFLFFFDDVLDIAVAKRCGGRIMMRRTASPMLNQYVHDHNIADYVTANDGGRHGLREGCELAIGLLGQFEAVVKNRSEFSAEYQSYFQQRQAVETVITQQKI